MFLHVLHTWIQLNYHFGWIIHLKHVADTLSTWLISMRADGIETGALLNNKALTVFIVRSSLPSGTRPAAGGWTCAARVYPCGCAASPASASWMQGPSRRRLHLRETTHRITEEEHLSSWRRWQPGCGAVEGRLWDAVGDGPKTQELVFN